MNVRICFLCEQYTPIHPENVVSQEFVKAFETWHHNHPVQTIPKEEVPGNFQCITPQEREKLIGEILNDIKR